MGARRPWQRPCQRREPKMRPLLLTIVVAVALVSCTAPMSRRESTPARERLQSLASRLEAGSIEVVEVYCIPEGVETPVALSPADLERTFDYRLTLKTSASPASMKKLAAALRGSNVWESTNPADMRFGLVFYDQDKIRRGAVYLAGDCTKGQIDEITVGYGGRLCSWVDDALSGSR